MNATENSAKVWILRRKHNSADISKSQDIENFLDDYYDERGWDIKTGIPTPQKLRELELHDEASHLEHGWGQNPAANN